MDQEKILEIQEKYQRTQTLEEQLRIVEQQIKELHEFSEAIKLLENSKEKEILAPVGKGVFIKSEMKEKEFFVDVGSGVYVKKKPSETGFVIDEQIRKLQGLRIQISSEFESLSDELRKLLEESQKG